VSGVPRSEPPRGERSLYTADGSTGYDRQTNLPRGRHNERHCESAAWPLPFARLPCFWKKRPIPANGIMGALESTSSTRRRRSRWTLKRCGSRLWGTRRARPLRHRLTHPCHRSFRRGLDRPGPLRPGFDTASHGRKSVETSKGRSLSRTSLAAETPVGENLCIQRLGPGFLESLDAADTSPASVRGRIEQSVTPQGWGLSGSPQPSFPGGAFIENKGLDGPSQSSVRATVQLIAFR
jgi:hypothetical protein